MAKNITIDLLDPITGHSGQITQITLRAPTLRDYAQFGEPYQQGQSRDGSTVVCAEDVVSIKGYLDALVQAPADAILLEQLSLTDTLRLKDAVLGFFSAARLRAFGKGPTSSSSTSDSSTQDKPST